MNRTKRDKEMLDGKFREASRIGMSVLVELAENKGVEEMVSISSIHDDSAWYEELAGLEFTEHLVDVGGKFVVPASLNACLMDLEKWQELRFDPELYIIHKRIEKAHTALGAAASWTCTPYIAGFVLRFGQQVA